MSDDDTMQTTATEDRAALLIAVPSASVAFMLAFNLGAFGEVFFEQVFTVWVMTTIVLVASFITQLPPKNWGGRALLLVPTLWVLLAGLADPGRPEDAITKFVFATTIFVTVICLPFVAWILISAINPDFSHLSISSRTAVAGWLVGLNHNVFLTCEDFEVSGNFVPKPCVKEFKESAAVSGSRSVLVTQGVLREVG